MAVGQVPRLWPTRDSGTCVGMPGTTVGLAEGPDSNSGPPIIPPLRCNLDEGLRLHPPRAEEGLSADGILPQPTAEQSSTRPTTHRATPNNAGGNLHMLGAVVPRASIQTIPPSPLTLEMGKTHSHNADPPRTTTLEGEER